MDEMISPYNEVVDANKESPSLTPRLYICCPPNGVNSPRVPSLKLSAFC